MFCRRKIESLLSFKCNIKNRLIIVHVLISVLKHNMYIHSFVDRALVCLFPTSWYYILYIFQEEFFEKGIHVQSIGMILI